MANMTKKPADSDPLFNFRMSQEVSKLLDEMRRVEPDLPNRSEMVRRCIQFAAEHKLHQGKRK